MSGKRKLMSAHAASGTCGMKHGQIFNLLDPQHEYLDPNPDIHSLFMEYDGIFFDGKLSGCEVKWSKRMTLCAGLCSYQPSSGFCSIRLSEPLLKLRPRGDLINTLLHEMIHAFIFVSSPVRDHEDHGPIFQSHMQRINTMAGTVITVFHTFHDEVDAYRQHWWQCDGCCRTKPPYFGLVKRAMNRPPGPRDPWWEQHQKSCGGMYTKIKDPPGFKEKQEKKRLNALKRQENKDKKANVAAPSVKSFFPSLAQDVDARRTSRDPLRLSSSAATPLSKKPKTKTSDTKNEKVALPDPMETNGNEKKLDDSTASSGVGTSGRPPLSESAFPFGVPESALLVAGEDGDLYLVGDMSAMFQFGQPASLLTLPHSSQSVKTETKKGEMAGDNSGGGVVDLTETDDDDKGDDAAVGSRTHQQPQTTLQDRTRTAQAEIIEILD